MGPLKTWNSALPDNYGTVACVVKCGSRFGILGASHVLCPLWDGVSVGAYPYVRIALGGQEQTEAKLVNWSVPINSDGVLLSGTRDAALATLSDAGAEALLSRMALPTGIAPPPAADQPVFFIGAKTGELRRTKILQQSTPVSMCFTMHLQYGTTARRPFYVVLRDTMQVDLQFGVLGGDSGCMLYDAQGRAVGMLVGTFDDYPYFMPLEPALSLFNAVPILAATNPANSIMTLIKQSAGALHV